MTSFEHRLLRVADKLAALGFPSSEQIPFYDGGFDCTTQRSLDALLSQCLTAIVFLECNVVNALPSEKDRKELFSLQLQQTTSSSSNAMPCVRSIATYFDSIASCEKLVGDILPPKRVINGIKKDLQMYESYSNNDEGERRSNSSSSSHVAVAALAVIKLVEIVVDLGASLVVSAEADAESQASSSRKTADVKGTKKEEMCIMTSSSDLLPAVPHTATVTGRGDPRHGGHRGEGESSAPRNSRGRRGRGRNNAAAGGNGLGDGDLGEHTLIISAADKKALEDVMVRLIALFGLSPPLLSSSSSPSASPFDLKRLTRMASRCVFLAQRILVAPADFGIDDATKLLEKVPLFVPAEGGPLDSSKKGPATPNALDQYARALRLLLTLESELLQRFVTMVVDEAQAFTAQCAFDPSGHRVGF